LIFSFPPLPEQQKIASFLSEIDVKIQSTTKQLEEAEKWKKGLLQGMFV
jgi:type I restriction enzyme S subunit